MKRKYLRKKSKLNIILLIVLLLLIYCILVIYVIYTERLKVTGIVTGNATFKVYFTDAWVENNSKFYSYSFLHKTLIRGHFLYHPLIRRIVHFFIDNN